MKKLILMLFGVTMLLMVIGCSGDTTTSPDVVNYADEISGLEGQEQERSALSDVDFAKSPDLNYNTKSKGGTQSIIHSINVAAIGGNFGLRAANVIFSSGDLSGTIVRLSTVLFNSMTPAQLRANYDVLLFTWNGPSFENADWNTRLLPFLQVILQQ